MTFLDDTKSTSNKSKNQKVEYIKEKAPAQQNEKAVYAQIKIFSNCIFDKVLVAKKYMELIQLNGKKKKNLI